MFGIILMSVMCFASGIMFYGIGVHAQKSRTPVSFWSGTRVLPEQVQDIPAYNQANAKMWKIYSLPYFLAAVSALGCIWKHWFTYVVLAWIAACSVGIFVLIRIYRKIEKKYVVELKKT